MKKNEGATQAGTSPETPASQDQPRVRECRECTRPASPGHFLCTRCYVENKL